jgi:acetyl-CoA synthetase
MTPHTATASPPTTRPVPLPAGEELERRLDQLLAQDRFSPREPSTQAARALYSHAQLDPEGFWAEQARRLDWQTPFTTVLDESSPPFYKWFGDGTLNVAYNCLDRHVEAGLGSRVAFYWRGEEGE